MLLAFQFFQPGKYLVGALNTFAQLPVIGVQRQGLGPCSHRQQDVVSAVLCVTLRDQFAYVYVNGMSKIILCSLYHAVTDS